MTSHGASGSREAMTYTVWLLSQDIVFLFVSDTGVTLPIAPQIVTRHNLSQQKYDANICFVQIRTLGSATYANACLFATLSRLYIQCPISPYINGCSKSIQCDIQMPSSHYRFRTWHDENCLCVINDHPRPLHNAAHLKRLK